MAAAKIKASATRPRTAKTKQGRTTHRRRTNAPTGARDLHPHVAALEALIEGERGRLMRVEALLGAAYIAFDSDEDDSPSIHIPTLIDLAYSLTRQVIAALESLHRLQVVNAPAKNNRGKPNRCRSALKS